MIFSVWLSLVVGCAELLRQVAYVVVQDRWHI